MRQATILYKDEKAGILTQYDDASFGFLYVDDWLNDRQKPAISLTFPKSKKEFYSPYLFPFFFNILPEGSNKQVICKHHQLDKDDYFSLLMIVAKYDSIGAIRVLKMED